MDQKHIEGYTNRKVINYSPLHDNQDWLFDVIYDMRILDKNVTNIYTIALQVIRSIMNKTQVSD